MQLKHIPITDMKVSRLNMRHGRKAPATSEASNVLQTAHNTSKIPTEHKLNQFQNTDEKSARAKTTENLLFGW
mgnify:CR=1 FL=1